MAYMGRGGAPSIGNRANPGSKIGYRRRFYRRCYYIPLDNTYVITQMLTTFLILIVGLLTYLFAYESTIIDPIENMKKTFINAHSIIIAVLLALTLITNFLSKSKPKLLKRLIAIFITSLIIMLVFLGIKLNYDATYTEAKFEEIYLEQNMNESSSSNSKIHIGLDGMSVKTEKEYYIDECIQLYNIFKVKTYGILGLHLLLNILLIYQILKVIKIQDKKDQVNKDDSILFDEEKNVTC